MTHTTAVDAVLLAFGAACFAGGLRILRVDGCRRRRAAARAIHPAVWATMPGADRADLLVEAGLARRRLAGEIDQATYQRGMSELAAHRGATELLA
ncbi:MAG: hypothetical protein LLG14_22425 [Nocardiaceae bacterium]|nr:hypothetical protein [Nocardiaceae bacterium]